MGVSIGIACTSDGIPVVGNREIYDNECFGASSQIFKQYYYSPVVFMYRRLPKYVCMYVCTYVCAVLCEIWWV